MPFKLGFHRIDKYVLIEALAMAILLKEKLEKLLMEEMKEPDYKYCPFCGKKSALIDLSNPRSLNCEECKKTFDVLTPPQESER